MSVKQSLRQSSQLSSVNRRSITNCHPRTGSGRPRSTLRPTNNDPPSFVSSNRRAPGTANTTFNNSSTSPAARYSFRRRIDVSTDRRSADPGPPGRSVPVSRVIDSRDLAPAFRAPDSAGFWLIVRNNRDRGRFLFSHSALPPGVL